MTRLILRIDFGPAGQIGPGKIRLPEEIGRTGSISAAGRALGMSYRRAWTLVDGVNRTFRRPAVSTQLGGTGGGGAGLTDWGRELVALYRAAEAQAAAGAAGSLAMLARELSADAQDAPGKEAGGPPPEDRPEVAGGS